MRNVKRVTGLAGSGRGTFWLVYRSDHEFNKKLLPQPVLLVHLTAWMFLLYPWSVLRNRPIPERYT